MSEKIYPCFCPTLDRGRGRTRVLLDELLELYRLGAPDGAEEILSLVATLANEDVRPFINYIITENSSVAELMRDFSQFIAASQPPSDHSTIFATGVASATGALTALLMAIDVAGGEVVTTSFNFPGVLNAVIMAGATPRFVDINEDDWCINIDKLHDALSNKTRAIVLTHVNKVIDIKPIRSLLEEKGRDIPLIEDASVAMGSTLAGVRPGAVRIGKRGAAVYSLAVSKVITGLGGSMVVSHDEDLALCVNEIAYQGMSRTSPSEQVSFGFNFKMNDMNAAIALAHLKRRDEIFATRRSLRKLYLKKLSALIERGSITMQALTDETVITHLALRLHKRDAVAQRVFDNHRVMIGRWPALHLQKPYQKLSGCRDGALPVTESLHREIAFLPFYDSLTEDDVAIICGALGDALEAR